MTKRAAILIFICLILTPCVSQGADWLYYIQNSKGDKYYIDIDSIKRVSPDNVRVDRKIEPFASSTFSHVVSHVELDCKERRIKLLTKDTYYKNGEIRTTQGDDSWQQGKPEDMDESLLELVCSLKKSE